MQAHITTLPINVHLELFTHVALCTEDLYSLAMTCRTLANAIKEVRPQLRELYGYIETNDTRERVRAWLPDAEIKYRSGYVRQRFGANKLSIRERHLFASQGEVVYSDAESVASIYISYGYWHIYYGSGDATRRRIAKVVPSAARTASIGFPLVQAAIEMILDGTCDRMINRANTVVSQFCTDDPNVSITRILSQMV